MRTSSRMAEARAYARCVKLYSRLFYTLSSSKRTRNSQRHRLHVPVADALLPARIGPIRTTTMMALASSQRYATREIPPGSMRRPRSAFTRTTTPPTTTTTRRRTPAARCFARGTILPIPTLSTSETKRMASACTPPTFKTATIRSIKTMVVSTGCASLERTLPATPSASATTTTFLPLSLGITLPRASSRSTITR